MSTAPPTTACQSRARGRSAARRVGDRSGKALPALLTSAGKAMVALLDTERAGSMLAGLDERDRTRTRRELAAARRNGYALNNQQTETGLTALGVALRGPHGQVLAGISQHARTTVADGCPATDP